MSAPTGMSPVPSPRRANAEQDPDKFLPAYVITRELAKHWDANGVAYRPAELRRTVRRLRGEGITSLADLSWRLDHADPVADDVVRHMTTGYRDLYRHSLKARS